MEAIRLEATVAQDGKVTVEGLRPGETVEVIVLRMPEGPAAATRTSRRLKGTLLKYDRPLDPVGLEDWDALK
jgi:hypothetical protein